MPMPCTTHKRQHGVQDRPAQTHPDDKQLATALEVVNAFDPESILMVHKGAVPTANDAKIASDGPVAIHSRTTRTDASPVQANEKMQGRRLAMLLSGNLTWAEHKEVYNLFARKNIISAWSLRSPGVGRATRQTAVTPHAGDQAGRVPILLTSGR